MDRAGASCIRKLYGVTPKDGQKGICHPLRLSDNKLFLLIFNPVMADWIAGATTVRLMTMINQHGNHKETELMLKGYGLTTAEFFYRLPDYRSVLNSYIWQDYDLAPDYPRLFDFIEFWQREIEGPLHSVRFTHRKMIGPGEWRNCVGEWEVN
ncbi:MAG: Usg protein, probable subunit of phosphoribosylanthranilate isomerase [Rhodobacteraceae bacterium HLUCCA12]|nr:MAG: Usg protein, probable subunit of phosphoribosylanthranilate isomerase [Rhodobacteraceae bacterium HLUCCA12]